ncbi:neurofilament heavy polypeptide-like [Drosophila suzukii]|uniref:Neurofilament heavy polypeptide-like n=1 Tax=Drosophila suzukii TaxID=28584 RepID=A0ABM4TVZ4_DROSZ
MDWIDGGLLLPISEEEEKNEEPVVATVPKTPSGMKNPSFKPRRSRNISQRKGLLSIPPVHECIDENSVVRVVTPGNVRKRRAPVNITAKELAGKTRGKAGTVSPSIPTEEDSTTLQWDQRPELSHDPNLEANLYPRRYIEPEPLERQRDQPEELRRQERMKNRRSRQEPVQRSGKESISEGQTYRHSFIKTLENYQYSLYEYKKILLAKDQRPELSHDPNLEANLYPRRYPEPEPLERQRDQPEELRRQERMKNRREEEEKNEEPVVATVPKTPSGMKNPSFKPRRSRNISQRKGPLSIPLVHECIDENSVVRVVTPGNVRKRRAPVNIAAKELAGKTRGKAGTVSPSIPTEEDSTTLQEEEEKNEEPVVATVPKTPSGMKNPSFKPRRSRNISQRKGLLSIPPVHECIDENSVVRVVTPGNVRKRRAPVNITAKELAGKTRGKAGTVSPSIPTEEDSTPLQEECNDLVSPRRKAAPKSSHPRDAQFRQWFNKDYGQVR